MVFEDAVRKGEEEKMKETAAAASSSAQPVPLEAEAQDEPMEADESMDPPRAQHGGTVAGLWVAQMGKDDLDDDGADVAPTGGGAKKDVPKAVLEAWERLLKDGEMFHAPPLAECMPEGKIWDQRTCALMENAKVAQGRHKES